jgi:cytochrome o ubiquinol oxidase subunit 2
VINKPGDYRGISANYSGAGFSGMHFHFYGMSDADFVGWVARNKASGGMLSKARYLDLAKPTEQVPVMRFANVEKGLFTAVVGQCVKPGAACMTDMMTASPGDSAAIRHEQGKGMPQGKTQDRPLTTSGAGGPPKNPADVRQRGPSSPSQDTTPHQNAL